MNELDELDKAMLKYSENRPNLGNSDNVNII